MSLVAIMQWLIYLYLSEEYPDDGEDGSGTSQGVSRAIPSPHCPVANWKCLTGRSRLCEPAPGSQAGYLAKWGTSGIAKDPAERCPTPLQVMGSLTLDAHEFETNLESLRAMMRLRPDLVAEPASEPPATQ